MESKEKGMKVLSLSCRVSDEAWNTIHILASNLRKNPADLVAQLIEAYVKKQDKTKGTKIADDIELPLEELFREGAQIRRQATRLKPIFPLQNKSILKIL
jgi:hypothetical protein